MRLTMKERQSVIAVMQERYRKAGKKLKRQILDECCRLTGYSRAYASHLLCHYKPALKRKAKAQNPSSGRKTVTPYYDGKVRQELVKIWMIMDCICGKRLKPFLSEIIPILEKHPRAEIGATHIVKNVGKDKNGSWGMVKFQPRRLGHLSFWRARSHCAQRLVNERSTLIKNSLGEYQKAGS